MSAKRVPTGFAIALALGIADLFFMNLYVSPKVFAKRSGGDAAALVPSVGPTSGPTAPSPSSAGQGDGPATEPDTAPTAPAPASPDDPSADPAVDSDDPPADPPSAQPTDPPAAQPTDPPAAQPTDPPAAPPVDPPDTSPATPPVQPAKDFKPSIHRMYFTQNRATIKSKHRKILNSVVTQLRQYPAAVAVVEAWADRSETRYGLPFLVKRRSSKVEDYLRTNGIAADRIRTVNHGVGKSEDVFVNRRVRLRVELP